jgi:hypothetical protein
VGSDLDLLLHLGKHLDLRLGSVIWKKSKDKVAMQGATVRDVLIESLLKIRSKHRRLGRLVPNRAQRDYSQRCTQRNIVLKARQLGITTYVAARFFIQTITQPGTLSVQVAHDQESAEEIFKIVHRFWENLPEALRAGVLTKSRSNTRQIVFPALDSEYRVETAADVNAGRGLTIHHLHCSEVARWPRDGMGTLASLRLAVPKEGAVVLESTANGAGGVFYEEWQRAEETGHTRHFFPWWYEDDYELDEAVKLPLTEEEKKLISDHGLSERQIAWRRKNWASLRGLAAQEYAEDATSCFRASGNCVFDMAAIAQGLEQSGEPLESRENRRLMIWWPPQTSREYIVGVDPAGGGVEGDYACAQVIERTSGLQCAEWHGHFDPRELATRVAELGRTYNSALVAVERNNHGHAVLLYLKDIERYGNLYGEGGQAGWLTSALSRPALIENFAAILATAPQLFHSPRLLSECRTFVRRADGNSAATTGAHDDCVMAMGIALAVRRAVVGSLSREGMVHLSSLSSLG